MGIKRDTSSIPLYSQRIDAPVVFDRHTVSAPLKFKGKLTDTLSIFFCAERGGYRNNRVILWKILIMRRVEKFFPGEVILPKQPLECIDFQGFIDSVSVDEHLI